MTDTAATSAAHREVKIVEAITLFFKNYLTFNGRSSRGAYWWFFVFSIIMSIITSVADMMAFPQLALQGMSPINIIWSLAILIPSLALGVRRLHDVGRSGWWILIALTIIGILLLIFWYVQPGQRRENSFGPDVEAGR